MEMGGSMFLWVLSLVMLVGSYLAGLLPVIMNLSEEKLQLVSVLGAGLLIGTALAVIIPEGIETLGNGEHSHHHHDYRDYDIYHDHDLHESDEEQSTSHSLIGTSLILGFVFMLLIEQCTYRRGGGKEKSLTATLGLVVHAAVDGIALGAAATTSQADVEMIVFIAIMLHKAPAAFGLVSFLLHEGVERKKIGRHLLVFSLSAPCLALLTYYCIGKEGKETLHTINVTGAAMLFSAGTFLYVATVHVLPELMMREKSSYSYVSTGEDDKQQTSGLKFNEIAAMVVGSFIPALIASGHHHHH
ncbi:zinc transporter ZIP9 [Orussus abietinus]|uniref:zinc transporter ZIP9 n=1 Tax=Orussus abietinus TaxID=222816 RepID=UPI000625D03F|nr:zinc transporter ZIP9 [Orussus abietinus]